MPGLRVLGHHVIDPVFQGTGVGKVQALVHAQAHQPGAGAHLVPQHVAKVLGAGHQPYFSHVGSAGAVQEQAQRHGHAHHQPHLDPLRQRHQQSGQHGHEIGPGVGPGPLEDAQIHQRQNRHDDGGRQRGLGQVVQRGRQKERRQGNANRGVNAGCRGLGARVEIHHRACKTTGHRETACESRRQVAGAQCHQLLVRLNPLTPFGGQGLAHRHRFHKAHHTDQQGRHRQRLPKCQVPQRQGQRRQALGHGTHDLHALALPVQRPGQHGCDNNRCYRAGFGQRIGQPGSQPQLDQQRLQALAHPKQKRRCQHPHRQREPVGIRRLHNQGVDQLDEVVALGLHAHQGLELAGRDQQARGRNETGDHRMAQKIGQKAQPQQPHEQ